MTDYSNEEIRAALGAATTVGEVAEFLNIDYPVSMHGVKFTDPKPDFAGFTAQVLEDYFQNEIFPDGSIKWDEMKSTLKDGGYTDYYKGGAFTKIKPFPHGEVRVEDDQETGGEGSQEDIYIVFSVTDATDPDGDEAFKRYFEKTGYCLSHEGSEWDGDFHEVWPKQKEITVWVTKKP